MRTNTLLSLALLTVAAGALAGCGEEPIPVNVSYAMDIKPLMEARCIRCHGAGGTLNNDPGSVPTPMGGVPLTMPTNGDFTRLEAVGMIHGLMFYTKPGGGLAIFDGYLKPVMGKPPLMPPAPAPQLTSREHDMLYQWMNNPLP
jgi:hypothetical protein